MNNLVKILLDKNRWRNPALYLALLAYLPAALALFQIQLAPEGWQLIENAVKAILDILVFLGILMNPTTSGITDKGDDE